MLTYYFTARQFDAIKNKVPHADPTYYTENGVVCVEVKINEDIFLSIANREGWI